MSQVGIGRNGILRVSSGSDNSVNPAGIRRAPNAVMTNKIQHNTSKILESAHANIGIGRLCSIACESKPRSTRPIGRTQSSCVRPYWWLYRRRKCRSEVRGDVLKSVHAQFGNENQMHERVTTGRRTIGWAQSSCAKPERWTIPWQLVQGGVVAHGNGCREQGLGEAHVSGCVCTHGGSKCRYSRMF